MIEILKFPSGDFTHSELATLNGKTNQQVWVKYQEAIKNGVIVSAGTRPNSGRGKPSKLWRLATGQPVPIVVAPVVPSAPKTVKVEAVPTEPIITPAVIPTPVIVVELPKVEPATAPTPAIIVDIEPSDKVMEAVKVMEASIRTVEVQAKNLNARTLREVCPVCKTALMAINDATGVMVWCSQPIEVCKSTENPFGHGKNEKEAFFLLSEKWNRAMSNSAE